MDQARLQGVAAEFPGDIPVQNGARLFRITYWTVLKGTPTRASGLLAIPLAASPVKGVVLYLHGTNATRTLAPSQSGRVDGNEETAVFAGNGYVVVLPDYIGLGVSKAPHPYLIVQPQVDASIDLLRAVRLASTKLGAGWSPILFMMGFSQGGQVVAGVHRALERQHLPHYRLRGSVGIAGPYDLRSASLPKAIENRCGQCVGYLTWAVYAYATYYGHPLGQALKPAYAGIVPTLFDGSKSAMEIGSALPDDPKDVFQPRFLATMRSAGDNWFTRALARNETYAWVPVAQFRLYFGDSDVDVSPSASKAFFGYARARGGNISLHPLAHANHQTSASMSYAPALSWFDEPARSH
ncbi:alpha/beta fold hydrolase [soil metagenome]